MLQEVGCSAFANIAGGEGEDEVVSIEADIPKSTSPRLKRGSIADMAGRGSSRALPTQAAASGLAADGSDAAGGEGLETSAGDAVEGAAVEAGTAAPPQEERPPTSSRVVHSQAALSARCRHALLCAGAPARITMAITAHPMESEIVVEVSAAFRLLRYCHNVVAQLLHDCYTTVTRPLHDCYTAALIEASLHLHHARRARPFATWRRATRTARMQSSSMRASSNSSVQCGITRRPRWCRSDSIVT